MKRVLVAVAALAVTAFAPSHAANLTAQPLQVTDANGTTQEVFCGLEKQDSGYIKLSNRVDAHYFYWYFESRSEPSTDPLVVWLPGGPGEGGTYGLLAENGPCTINDDLSTTLNPYSWTTNANMVWLDIPVNSGFSYSTVEEDDEFTEDRVDESVFWFLQGFLEKHPELQGREVFLVGESMGGHYVPAVAHYIWQQQHERLFTPGCSDFIPINLKGIAMGNGFTDPTEVDSKYGHMAVNNLNITLANETQLEAIRDAAPQCEQLMNECQANLTLCPDADALCTEALLSPLLEAHRNPYDIRQECNSSDLDVIECLLKVPNLKAYLNSPGLRDFLGRLFRGADVFGVHFRRALVSELLEVGVRVLMYAGDADLICNVYATEATAEKLQWSGAAGFSVSQSLSYTTESGIADAGRVRSYSRLTFVEVHNAGHMVPGDQPEVALDMITKFTRNEMFY
ncbi:hypothetical protein BBJ28_00012568 [Nothophytophthora sp. Chile5]|nr:hypothetical protein BBJ28_00012568 [Nothophytophthora sp. Chile5]